MVPTVEAMTVTVTNIYLKKKIIVMVTVESVIVEAIVAGVTIAAATII